ncbi:LysR substrate-binding domain-containing protein [Denitrobaculum tricleocarpae]|uniref:LysR family transcriptional regulator n=1 Tax=Denitrobaculum tricleocarpae TaxID=2591009 RepID=A0A545STA9_9PROT|nr:LysR substrate-binding domain-containing protein [Denitrobaculum tricleocarpae]TQV68208.1 LysR family transcriptional regulator [Denitrobaculum tricleocarpae]
MRFTLRQLEYFVAAGETESITRASERTSISQPSISTAISQLEKELGVQLFVRHHAQGLSLTPAGRRLLREAKALLEQAEGLYHLADEVSGQLRGSLSIGCLVTLAPMIIPALSHSFATAFPEAELRAGEADQEALLERLRRAEIDAAITYDLQIPNDITFRPLVSLPPHVLVSDGHPLAGRDQVQLAELAPEPLILLDLPISREYFLAMFMREGLEPNIGARSAQQEVVRTMVANGQGYSLANIRPRSDQAMDGRKLVRLPLSGDYRPMTIGIATAAQITPSRLLSAFEDHCAARISESHIPGMITPDEED